MVWWIITAVVFFILELATASFFYIWIGVGALGCAYVMQGLATVHSLSRRLPARIPMLIALYLVCIVTALWSTPALALVGLVESLLSLRARRAAAANAKS